MNSIRNVRLEDLESLLELASHASVGLTTLIADEKRLRDRIAASLIGEAPLLVMTDASDQNVIGTAGLFTRVGDASRVEPFYAYRVERSVHHCESLNVHHELDALHLVKMFNGPTELGTLFLHPDHRGGGNGRVLSLSRFLLMVLNPTQFDRQVIAELRGVVDEEGYSPFWDALGRHFFQVEFSVADRLSTSDRRFIAELMPSHPIYVPLLPPEAQAVIGKVHSKTEPARRLLEREGFYFSNMVDIFDAGPCVRCDAAAIRSIREAKHGVIAEICDESAMLAERREPPGTSPEGLRPSAKIGQREYLVARASGEFRLVASQVRMSPMADGSLGVSLPKNVAATLEIAKGDPVCVTPLRGESNPFGSQWPVLATGSF